MCMHTHLDRSWQGVLGRIFPDLPALLCFRYHLLVTREPGYWVVQTADLTRFSLFYHTSPSKKGGREEGTKKKETVLWKKKPWEGLQSGTWGDGVASWDLPFSWSWLLTWTTLLDSSCLPLPARGLRSEQNRDLPQSAAPFTGRSLWVWAISQAFTSGR